MDLHRPEPIPACGALQVLIVRTPVRISLAGGGTDLPAYYERFGGAVVSTAINKYFYTVLTRREDGRIQIISADLKVNQTWEAMERMAPQGQELRIPIAAMQQVNRPLSANLFLASEIPPGTGLGSSGAVCVNVLRALHAYFDLPLSRYQLAETAYHIAHHVLESPVGKQDEYAAAFGGLNYIRFHRDGSVKVEPLDLPPETSNFLQERLMLFDTGASHNSWDILKHQEEVTRHPHSAGLESLHEIRATADRMREALLRADMPAVGELLHAGWEAKRQVAAEITNPRVDGAYAAARSAGALGGKISGAGGGGFLLLFCPPGRQESVRQALGELGMQQMHFTFDTLGSHVIVNDPFVDRDPRCGMRWRFQALAGPPENLNAASL